MQAVVARGDSQGLPLNLGRPLEGRACVEEPEAPADTEGIGRHAKLQDILHVQSACGDEVRAVHGKGSLGVDRAAFPLHACQTA